MRLFFRLNKTKELSSSMEAKKRLIRELARDRARCQRRNIKEELKILLSKIPYIKENKIEFSKNSKAQMILKINAKIEIQN